MDHDPWVLGDCVGDGGYGPHSAGCELTLPSLRGMPNPPGADA
jgi:hypothetical protein